MENSIEKKIDLNKIIDEMHQKFGEDGLSEFEKARYLYIELGKLFRFNMNYITFWELKQEDIYFKPVDFDNIETNNWICVQMSKIYEEALRRVGITAGTKRDIKSDEDYDMPHKYTVVELSDGREFVTDMIYDLPYIQMGMQTWNFGTNSENGTKTIISEREIKEADDKIGYTSQLSENEKAYTEAFLEMIKDELNNPERMKEYVKNVYNGEDYKEENLISYKLDLIKHFMGLQTMGGHEGSKLLGILYKSFFSEEERKKLSFFLLCVEPYENHQVGEVEKLVCYCFKRGENDCQYYAYEEGTSLEKIDRELLVKKLKSKPYIVLRKTNENKEQYGDDIFFK